MVRFIISLLALFVLYEVSFAFDDIVEGKEYKFKYHLSARSYVKHGPWSMSNRKNAYLKGDLAIKGLPGNWHECYMTEVQGYGLDYLEEFKNKFKVKLDGEKVVEVESTGTFTEQGNKKKKEMIEQIVMDRSDIVRLFKNGHHDSSVRVEMPIGGKCKPEHLKEEAKTGKKYYKVRSTAPNCVIKSEALAPLRNMGFSEPTEDSPTEVTLIYATVDNKQIGLHLYAAIKMLNHKNSDIVLANERIEIEYLGSNDITH